MSNGSSQRVQELFLAALELPDEQRDPWLVDQCGADSALLDEVRSLIRHDSPDDDPLEQQFDEAFAHLQSTVVLNSDSGQRPTEADEIVVDSQHFLSKLTEVGVLSSAEIQELGRSPAESNAPDPRQLASQLVEAGKLTPFQASALLKGQPDLLIDKYLILDLLDAGGMGMVFKAVHRPMNRLVALKMIAKHLMDSHEEIRRFRREVQVAATLEHPNIVRAYDADESNGVHFLVMEFVRGENLAKRVHRRGPMKIERAIDCIFQAAKGLRYAHKHGVVHRDIKPGNLMLTKGGLVKVLDLGLANFDESLREAQQSTMSSDLSLSPKLSGSKLTVEGTMLGTVSFMAPEQSLDSHQADTRADIYSLGCTLYYLLAGEAPYRGETIFEIFEKHQASEIPSLRDKRPDVPDDIDAICRKMLAKSTDDRFQTMGELLAAIEDCDINLPQPKHRRKAASLPAKKSSPAKTQKQDHRTSKRSSPQSPSIWAPMAIACLIIVGAYGGYRYWNGSAREEKVQQAEVVDNASSQSVPPAIEIQEMKPGGANVTPDANDPPRSAAELLATGEWEWQVVEHLPEPVNSPLWDRTADMSADGCTIVFASDRAEGRGVDDIWMATRNSTDEPWPQPELLGENINSVEGESRVSILGDGLTLYFTRAGKIHISQRQTRSSSWSPAELFEVNPGYQESLDMTSDGLSFVVTRQVNESRDLFLSRRRSLEEPWGEVVRLGPEVNTTQHEHAGTMSDDGRLLVFERKLENGPNGGELWMSMRSDWSSPWSEAIPISTLNTQDHEGYPRLLPDGKSMLFQSTRSNAVGLSDMYLARLVRQEPSNSIPAATDLVASGDYEWKVVERYGDPIRARYAPSGADMTADRRTIVFTSRFKGVGAKQRDADLWMSARSSANTEWSRPVPLGSAINSGLNEVHPALSADGLTLLFTRLGDGGFETFVSRRDSTNDPWAAPKRFEFDGYYAPDLPTDQKSLLFSRSANLAIVRRSSAEAPWPEARFMRPPIKSDAAVHTGAMSEDGRLIVFTRDNADAGGKRRLWMATRADWDSAWSEPIPISLPGVSLVNHPRLLADGQSILFTGDNDICLARLVRKPTPETDASAADLIASGNYEWQVVEHFDEPINTGASEGSADMTADGLTIVFSTINGKGSYGGHDLWMCSRESITSPWSDRVNLGGLINTERHELDPALSDDGLTLIFRQGNVDGNGRSNWISTRESVASPWSAPTPFELNSNFPPDPDPLGLSSVLVRWHRGNPDLWMSRRASTDVPWPQPTHLEPPVNSERCSEETAALSGDGRLLIFSRYDKEIPLKPRQLWMTTRDDWDSPWTEPVPIATLNSGATNQCPRLLADGKTMLFRSLRPDGNGLDDIFLARLVRKQPRPKATIVEQTVHDWPADVPKPAIAPFDSTQAKTHQQDWAEFLNLPVEKKVDLNKGQSLTMVLIPPGEFLMGSTTDQQEWVLTKESNGWMQQFLPAEGPQHRVQITRPFYISKYEVTQAEWESMTGENPSEIVDQPTHPVENLKWHDSQKCLELLNALPGTDGLTFALPTEAQWEYACRAGTTTMWNFGENFTALSEYAWTNEKSSFPVGQLKPNAFGLHDMHGNAREWCRDWYDPEYYKVSPIIDPSGPVSGERHVSRGLAWHHKYAFMRSAYRECLPLGHSDWMGLRPVATILSPKLPEPETEVAVMDFAADSQTQELKQGTSADLDSSDRQLASPGEVNLLAGVEFPRDEIAVGDSFWDWEVWDGGFSATRDKTQVGGATRVQFPTPVYGDYEVDVDLTVRSGGLCCLNLPLRHRTVHLVLRAHYPSSTSFTGLELVDDRLHTTGSPSAIKQGEKQRLHVSVSHSGDSVTIHGILDGAVIADYEGPLDRVSNHKWLRTLDSNRFVLRTGADVTVHSARCRPVSAADLLETGEWEWRIAQQIALPPGSPDQISAADMTADGLTLFFSAGRNWNDEDLWMTTRASLNDEWARPSRIEGPINSRQTDTHPIISADGQTLMFTRAMPGKVSKCMISARESTTSPWSKPLPLDVPGTQRHEAPEVTPNGLALLFQGRKAGVEGRKNVADLFICRRSSIGHPWSAAQALPNSINSTVQEYAGTLSNDGRMLIFVRTSRDGRTSDFWMTTRGDWNSAWSKPRLLESLNSPRIEHKARLLADGKSILLTSKRGGSSAIYLAQLVRKISKSAMPDSNLTE